MPVEFELEVSKGKANLPKNVTFLRYECSTYVNWHRCHNAEIMMIDDISSQQTPAHASTHAVILAAGIGSRLGAVCNGLPKCLMDVGGRTLIQHHLDVLRELGVDKILVVVGHGAEKVMSEVKHAGVVQFNASYASTNSLYSLWLTRKWIAGNLMLINADVLADPQIYRNILEEDGNALAFDSSSGRDEEEMKVQFEAGRLCAISKRMDAKESHGENLGILKFDERGAKALLEEADRIVKEGRVNDWAPTAVRGITDDILIKGVDVSELPWTEIDFREDLEHARKRVWPAIADRNPTGAGSQSLPCELPPPVSLTNISTSA